MIDTSLRAKSIKFQKTKVFSSFLNTGKELEERTETGNWFHNLGAANYAFMQIWMTGNGLWAQARRVASVADRSPCLPGIYNVKEDAK